MVRRYGDPVEVLSAPAGDRDGGADRAPVRFRWRGRPYVVHEVLGHWRERRAWWREPAARAVLGEVPGGGIAGGDAQASRAAVRHTLSSEYEIWRVEACHRGRSGVYDLRLDLPCDPAAPGRWHLLRVAD